jgi:translation initiation factor IF-1
VETLEEYEKAHRVIESDLQQQRRLLRAGKEEEAAALSGTIEAMHQARDRWADANGVERKRRVEERQRLNNMKIKAGVQLISEGSRSERATSSPRSCVRATARRVP